MISFWLVMNIGRESSKRMSYKLDFFSLNAIIKHWKLKPLQLLLMVLGLTTATALWNSVHLINAEAKKAYSDAQSLSKMYSQKIDFRLPRWRAWSDARQAVGYLGAVKDGGNPP